QPVKPVFMRLARVIREACTATGKQARLVLEGEGTEVDTTVIENLNDPLTHLIRNSIDHGLESPEKRRELGKPEEGTIKVSAFHMSGRIVVTIDDDGAGINRKRVLEKAVEKGIVDAGAELADSEIDNLVFAPGFSTAQTVSDLSGRGVGMDVVRSNIEKIGGKIEFRSIYGKGSTFTIKIPLTLAIVSSLIVTSGEERFALPQIAVHEVVRISDRSENQIDDLKGAPILRLRDRLLPLVNLNELLSLNSGEGSWRPGHNAFQGYVVVCRNGSQDMGIIVDSIADTEEIVVKPLSPLLGATKHFSGNTILGDGRVVLILDLNGLSSSLSQEAVQAQADEVPAEQPREDGQSILLFKTMREGLKAVPLSQVQRIENFDMGSTEAVQGEIVIQYRSGLLPLVSFDGDAGIRREGHQQVLVFVSNNRAIGLAIDSIVDIAHDRIKLGKPSREPGIVGSGIIAGRAADVVDPEYFLGMVPDSENSYTFSEVA
ncbi:MAG: chemotaxis protein CheW, partial [Rhodobacteraceae bacterium]|nr:chemotaxis protein CheW [Paracoccaceae bacterium]